MMDAPRTAPPEMVARCRSHDWATTALGARTTWPATLQAALCLVLDAPTPMCLYIGAEYVMLYNDAFRRILGTKHPSAFAQPAAAVWPEIWSGSRPQLESVRTGGAGLDVRDVPFLIDRTDGGSAEEAWFDYTLMAVRGEACTDEWATGTDVVAVLALVTDTTARVRGEQTLAMERARLASVLTVMGDAHIAMDRDWRVLAMNPAAERITGRSADQVIGRTHWEVWPQSVGTELERQYRHAMRTRVPVQFETRYTEAGAVDVHVEMDAVPTADGGLGVFGRDVTARRLAEAANARLLADTLAERVRTDEILEGMADAHFVLDADFRFVSANPAMSRYVGLSRAALLGRSIWELFPGTIDTIFERSYRRVASEGAHVHFIGEYDENGLTLVPEVDAYPAPGGGVAVFWRDIRPRLLADRERERLLVAERAARADAEAAQSRAEAVLASISDAFYLLDRDWRFTYVNAAAEPLLQTTGDKLLGRTLWEMFPGVIGSVFEAPYREAMATGRTTSAEAFFAPLDTWFDVRTFPWDEGLMVYFRDIGAREAAEAEREALLAATEAARRDAEDAKRAAEHERERAMEANRAKSDFLTVMSHELRTPLNAIGGYTQLLQLGIRGPVTVEQHADLERIQRSQHHLLGLINGVLNYAKIEAGAVEYHIEDVDVEAVLGACEALIGPQVRSKGLTLEYRAGSRGLHVRADAEKLQQVVLNLLSNAVKFTKSGGRIALDASVIPPSADQCQREAQVEISVSDTGIGIAAHSVARVFEPFVQVDARLTRSEDGTGLGLAISRDLARGMGGEITVDTAPGAGSTFRLMVPAAESRERVRSG
ncbi:MAG TPA: PAS domain-containing protein [Gemmatimonadaceae bacterium]|nr:PAS domain-containing protein [Gemmatimonadaceae bacterium]